MCSLPVVRLQERVDWVVLAIQPRMPSCAVRSVKELSRHAELLFCLKRR